MLKLAEHQYVNSTEARQNLVNNLGDIGTVVACNVFLCIVDTGGWQDSDMLPVILMHKKIKLPVDCFKYLAGNQGHTIQTS